MLLSNFKFSMSGKFKISINSSTFSCSGIIHTNDTSGKPYFELHHINESGRVYLIRYVELKEINKKLFLIYMDDKLEIIEYDNDKISLKLNKRVDTEEHSIERLSNNKVLISNN